MSEEEVEATDGEGAAAAGLSNDEKCFLEYCFSGDNAFVKTLLLKGVSPQTKGLTRGVTGLHCGAGTGRIDVVQTLLQFSASAAAPDNMGLTPIHYAAGTESDEVLTALIESLGDDKPTVINMQDEDACTALHYAAFSGRKASVEVLLAAGADKALTDSAGKTAKDDAEGAGHAEVAALL